MADIALIITSVIFGLLIIAGAFYFLVYFQHPDDKWVAWWPKIVVILCITLSCYNVFLLPLDTANQGGSFEATGGIPMAEMTLAFFISSVVLAIAVVPFTMFYYEGLDESEEYEDDASKQVFYAVQWSCITLAIYFAACGILWATTAWAVIPVTFLEANFEPTTDFTFNYCSDATQCTIAENVNVEVPVSFLIYMITTASLAGWVLFSVFGGVGLPALPFDMLMDYKYRPKRIKLQEYTDKKKMVGEQASLLLQASAALMEEKKKAGRAKNFQNSKQRAYKKKENEFKKDVLFLESQYKRLEDAYRNGGGNPLFFYAELLVGFVGSFLSLFWFIHICIYVLPLTTTGLPVHPFLNEFFKAVFTVPFFGIAFYGLFSFWLLLCTMKGVTKMGVRFLFIEIHPVKYGETMMGSLVFNSGVMLFCSMAVTQFCTVAFQDYAVYTAVVSIFGAQIHYFKYLNYVFDALIYVIPIMAAITMVYIWLKPYDHRMKPII